MSPSNYLKDENNLENDIKGADNFPVTAIVGRDDVKRLLTIMSIDPDLGSVLIKGKEHTQKKDLVRSFSQIIKLSTGGKNRFKMINGFHDDPLLETVRRYNERSYFKYIAIMDIQNYDEDDLEEILSYWAGNRKETKTLLMISNMDSGNDGILNKGSNHFFHAKTNPIVDIEKRIEIIKRQRDFRRDEDRFWERYIPSEKKFLERIIEAKKVLKSVRISESLREDLHDTLESKISGSSLLRPVGYIENALKYSKAVAAYQGRKWVSRENIKESVMFMLFD
ncbi:MAG: hypothetical protein ACQESD_03720 [Thermoplasmatota archaeon]